MSSRPFDADRDLSAVQRIWREVGWVSSDEEAAAISDFLSSGTALVTEIDGEAEAAVHGVSGTMKYQKDDVPLWCISAVTVSRIARKQRLAQGTTLQPSLGIKHILRI
jgi:hypothetical protein